MSMMPTVKTKTLKGMLAMATYSTASGPKMEATTGMPKKPILPKTTM